MTMNKQDILNSMQTFVNQRPGLEPANYGDVSRYRREYREHCHKPKQDFEALASAVEWRDGLTADDLRDSFKLAFGGRLEMRRDSSLDYTPGQYGAVEYRRAACAVLARALWDYWAVDAPIGQTPREYIEDTARREFGRGIAARWFN